MGKARNGTNPAGDELVRMIPEIRRARSWRLYTPEGKRLVDLWQYGGRAFLGHNPPGMLRALKNTAERGLFAPFPHAAEGRFLKALAVLLPGRAFRLYADETSLYRALACAAAGDFAVWRPLLETPQARIIVPVLPFPFPGAPSVLALSFEAEKNFPLPPPLSPFALAAAARCIHDLISAPARPDFPKLNRALLNSSVWRRQAVYVSRNEGGDYASVFRTFLDGGFLLPPSCGCPLILPGELSPGEETKLAALFTA